MNIVITGASRGIGKAEAALLAPQNQLFLTASDIASLTHVPAGAQVFGADFRNPEASGQLAKEIAAKTGSVDVLINNVGVMIMKRFEDMNEDDLTTLLNVNLRSHLSLTRALLPQLKKGTNPHIIFMSSMAAKSYIVGESVYAATKAAITSLAGVLRNELAEHGIRVSVVHSWGVNTWGAEQPELFLRPEDIAETVGFIVSRPPSVIVESVDLSNISQWRGGLAPWSPGPETK